MQKTIQIQAQNRYNCRHKYKCRCNHAGTNTDTTTVIYNEDTKTKTDGYTHTKVHCTLVWKLEAGVGFIPALPTRCPIRRVPTLPINAQIHLPSPTPTYPFSASNINLALIRLSLCNLQANPKST